MRSSSTKHGNSHAFITLVNPYSINVERRLVNRLCRKGYFSSGRKNFRAVNFKRFPIISLHTIVSYVRKQLGKYLLYVRCVKPHKNVHP